MMFVVGQGERVQTIGPPELTHCAKCEQEREFIPQLKYSYGQLDLLFGFVYGRQYRLLCPHCGHGWLLNRGPAEALYGKPAIPFRLPYGLVVLATLLALIGTAAYVHQHAA
ncbi:hypothetical protein [Lysobacter sp. HA35]